MNKEYILMKLAQNTAGNALNRFSNKEKSNQNALESYHGIEPDKNKFFNKPIATPISGSSGVANSLNNAKPTINPFMKPNESSFKKVTSEKTTPPQRVGTLGISGTTSIK